MAKCCSFCFDDSFLTSFIERNSDGSGKCTYCGTESTLLIDCSKLTTYFQSVVDLLYSKTESTEGEKLQNLFVSDWQILGSINDSKAEKLLSDILGNEPKRYLYVKNIKEDQYTVEDWEKFREELKHSNRYFPKLFPNKDDNLIRVLNELEVKIGVDTKFYRSRINKEESPFAKHDMGKPKNEISTAGRANPHGISYLYLASDLNTAISEIRPHKHEIVSVAEFSIKKPLIHIDLRNPRQKISPFKVDSDLLALISSCMNYLCYLGSELTKPVSRHKADLEYLPTQYLCEFIKSHNWDGVLYKSSLSDGYNCALFYDENTEIIDIQQYKVTEIDIKYENIRIDRVNVD